MSQLAPKRTAMPPVPPPAAKSDRTGRFAIDRARPTVLPPPGLEAAAVLSPDELGAVLEADPTTESSATNAGEIDRGSESGVFSKGGLKDAPEGEDPALAQLADSLLPYYREAERKSERAELRIEDLSLRLDNPYAASSLVPPPERPKTVSKRVVIGVGAALLAAAGGGALLMQLHLAAPAHSAPPQAVVSVPARPVRAASGEVGHGATLSAATPATKETETTPGATAPAPTRPEAVPVQPEVPPVPSNRPATAANRAPERKVAAAAAQVAAPKADSVAPVPTGVPAKAAAPDLATQQPLAAGPVQPNAGETEAAAALPETPTRAEVAAGFEALRGALSACAEGKHGQLDIDATVANSGRVSHALIEGAFKGSPAGSCMARAVRTARFPQFSRSNLKVRYVIAL